MKTLYLDCSMGAAGDMLTAALYELLDEPERKAFLDRMNGLGLKGVAMWAEPSEKCGIVGTRIRVRIGGEEEGEAGHEEEHEHPHHEHDHDEEHEHHHHDHGHEHHHGHDHSHAHHHRSMREIEGIIDGLPLSEAVRQDAKAVYGLIAEAESRAHGVPVTEIHFHEVGMMDAIADVTAVCLLMERLGVQRVAASPVHVGSGQVRSAHGILPVPAPATAYILKDVPIYGGGIRGELCTPTGAALLRHFAASFDGLPAMKVQKIGYGMGTKDFEAANCVRAMLGESAGAPEEVLELCCNIDDMTAERLGFAMERLLAAGALDAYTLPAGMKKSRPGTLLCVLCREEKKEELLRLIFRHTSTLGIREHRCRRYTLARRTQSVSTPYGDLRLKRAEGYGVSRQKYEHDDLARVAADKDLSIEEVLRTIRGEQA